MEADQITGQFRQNRDYYAAFTPSIESLLRNLISTIDIEPFSYESRTKTISSFDEKIQREEKSGKYNCLEDITDLSGVRIICYLQEDCDAVCRLIEEEFNIDKDNSSSKKDILDPDKFGYLSSHYIICLDDKRSCLKEFKPFSLLKAEIQVRTLLQHTWAAIDWKFRYKEEREAPKLLRRRLFRISALLEAADNEFSQVKIELDNLRKDYVKSFAAGDLAIAINSESVATYLKDSRTVNSVINSAKDNGVKISATEHGEAINRLIATTESLGLKTIEDLDNALIRLIPESNSYYRFVSDFVRNQRTDKDLMLYKPAALRYLLLGFAPSGKRLLINKVHTPAQHYGEAMAAFDRLRKSEGKND